MIALDTNVLIYAHRQESRRHRESLSRVTRLAESDVLWGLPVFCLAEFTRVVTHLRVFNPPSTLDTALTFIDRLLESPSLRLLLPGPGYPRLFRQVCEAAEVRGNLVFDAQIAAVCLERGATEIITADRDFSRFQHMRPVFI